MVAFAGQKYAARSIPILVADTTHTITSFTLVNSNIYMEFSLPLSLPLSWNSMKIVFKLSYRSLNSRRVLFKICTGITLDAMHAMGTLLFVSTINTVQFQPLNVKAMVGLLIAI